MLKGNLTPYSFPRFKVKRAYSIQDGVKVMDIDPSTIHEMLNNKKNEFQME